MNPASPRSGCGASTSVASRSSDPASVMRAFASAASPRWSARIAFADERITLRQLASPRSRARYLSSNTSVTERRRSSRSGFTGSEGNLDVLVVSGRPPWGRLLALLDPQEHGDVPADEDVDDQIADEERARTGAPRGPPFSLQYGALTPYGRANPYLRGPSGPRRSA